MSAICAVYRWDGLPSAAGHARMLLDAMDEYGGDAQTWAPPSQDSTVALGCIPWGTTPEDQFHRGPVKSPDGTAVLVADARIDNRDDIGRRLGLPAHQMAVMSDPALILAAWQQWGRECPRHLVGDFAFIIWDARARELFCARDALGQRVLFYHESPGGIELATTPHALASLPGVETALDEQKVADFLVLLQREESTFFRGIARVPSGSVLMAGGAGVRIERYWSASPTRMLRLRSDAEYVEAFREVFDTAVRSQLRSASGTGIMLSGGLDSASVAAGAARALAGTGRELLAFHAAPPDGFVGRARRGMVVDESDDVEALARMHPVMRLHVRRGGWRSPLEGLETYLRLAGAPPRNPGNAGWFHQLCADAARAGVRVLLSGHKGNVTISQTGLRSLRDSAVRGQWRRVWRETTALARVTGSGRRAVFRREVVEPLTPRAWSMVLRRVRRQEGLSVRAANQSPIRPEFARAMAVEERLREARRRPEDLNRLSDMEYRLTSLAGGADVFDLYSAYRPWFDIETRDPTADRRVVDFCMAVPGSQYLRNGETRSLLRRAMEGRLPDSLRLRRTYGMQAADWTEWLPPLRGEITRELQALEGSEAASRCLDLPRMRRLVDQWPDRFTLRHERDYILLLLRGVSAGRFIRLFEERYG